jgi:hypothetical protein
MKKRLKLKKLTVRELDQATLGNVVGGVKPPATTPCNTQTPCGTGQCGYTLPSVCIGQTQAYTCSCIPQTSNCPTQVYTCTC